MNKTHMINVIDSFLFSFQTPFIFILNSFYRVTGKLSEKTRKSILGIVFILLPTFYIVFYSGVLGSPTFMRQPLYTVVGTLLFIVLIIFSINGELKHVYWRRSLIFPMILAGAGIAIVGFIHTVGAGFHLFGFQLIFVFPAFFLVWNNRRDYDVLYKGLSEGTAIVVFVYFILCLILAFFGEFAAVGTRWAGTMTNVNLLSQIGTNAVLLSMYGVVTFKKKRLLFFCVLGIGFGFTLLGGSRGAMGTCILCAVSVIIFLLVHNWDSRILKFDKAKFAKALMLLIALILFFGITYAGLPSLQKTMYFSKNHVEYILDDSSSIDRITEKPSGGANAFTSGRVQIWKKYIKDLNALGHDYDSTDWKKRNVWNGHNIFLEVAYRVGWPIAALFILPQIIAGLIALFLLFDRRKKNPNHLFFILLFLEYFYESTVDVAVMPFHRFTVLLFYISLACIINKKKVYFS